MEPHEISLRLLPCTKAIYAPVSLLHPITANIILTRFVQKRENSRCAAADFQRYAASAIISLQIASGDVNSYLINFAGGLK